MFLHPSVILFFSLLFLTIFMIISVDSWLMMWLFLEINLLLFIPLLFSKKSKYQGEASLKYFINQAMASVLILSSITFLSNNLNTMSNTLCLALSLKMGVAPLHGWLVSVSNSISWFSLWLLLIPQKVAPMMMMICLTTSAFSLLVLLISMTALMGAMGGLTAPAIKKMMAYSSISQMGWLMSALLCGRLIWSAYFAVYSAITSTILITLSFMKANKINDFLCSKYSLLKTIMLFNMLAMAGLPPFTGFIMKMSLIIKLNQIEQTLFLLPLIMSSLVSLYFYMRIFYTNFLSMTNLKKENQMSSMEKMLIFINTASLPMGLIFLF
uniref:NADH dehydrogenase subunit 2 n=1 Tax=Caprella penantis TaxID=1282972 RepID=UPI0023D83BD8|nr:NADH dehydrogenase subunit 2 [Caprella penantis]WCR50873.1 NADH dehydrogenase subunit 2 [Caprella penantis]